MPKVMYNVLCSAGTTIKIANIFTIPACISLCVLATPISKLIYATPHAGPIIAVIKLEHYILRLATDYSRHLARVRQNCYSYDSHFIGLLAKTFLDYELTGTIELGINGAAWATNLNFAICGIHKLYILLKICRICT